MMMMRVFSAQLADTWWWPRALVVVWVAVVILFLSLSLSLSLFVCGVASFFEKKKKKIIERERDAMKSTHRRYPLLMV